MPPSREFKVVIDPGAQSDLEQHLDIDPYRVKLSRTTQTRLHGTHHRSSRLIVIELGHTLFAHSSLRAVKTEILNTILHEFRHAYQHTHWTPQKIAEDKKRPYRLQEMEIDAEEWAERNAAKWRQLFSIRPISGNNLGRLAAAERQVRR